MELQRVERDCERKYGQLLEVVIFRITSSFSTNRTSHFFQEEMEKYSQSSKEMSEKNDLVSRSLFQHQETLYDSLFSPLLGHQEEERSHRRMQSSGGGIKERRRGLDNFPPQSLLQDSP
jgi:hypothetical protein